MAKQTKVFGNGNGLVGYADRERAKKGGKPLFESWESIEKRAKSKK
jgi:hypothetical protein